MHAEHPIRFLRSLDELPVKSNIVLYGAGTGGSEFKRLTETHRPDINIECFVDDSRTGEKEGIRIISPEELRLLKGKNCAIVVTSSYWRKIITKLKDMDFDNVLVVNQEILFPSQTYTEKEEGKYKKNFEDVKRLLKHKEDRNLYDILLNMRKPTCGNIADPFDFFLSNYKGVSKQYLDFIVKEKIRVIIEGGVADGKTTKDFIDILPADGFIYGFEPFYDFYLEGEYRDFLKGTRRVKVYPVALWKNIDRLMFSMDVFNREGSKIVGDGERLKNIKEVNAISIDEFVKKNGIKPDFIKLDIEGSELEALEGAKETLRICRPQLAICIYHKKEHLFEIPLFLDGLLDDYVYRLGHYSSSFWDTVLYAIPEEIYGGGIIK